MNKPLSPRSTPSPFLAIYRDGKPPPHVGKHLLQPILPSVVHDPFKPWTSCLTSRPDNFRHPNQLYRPDDPNKPMFKTVGMLIGTWDPGKHPSITVSRQHPIRPEDRVSPHSQAGDPTATDRPALETHAAKPSDVDAAADPPEQRQHPIHPEKPPSPSPLRNGNRQGNPSAAPRCSARTRLGCPCRGPAMKNGKCRMHGGASTGAKTVEGRARIAAARTIHGGYGAEARAFQAKIAGIKRRGRVLCAFARSELSFAAVVPLLHEVQATGMPRSAPRADVGRTPCAQKTRGHATDDAMLALMTIELSARQTTALTHLIRTAGRTGSPRRQPARKRELGGKHPIHPETTSHAPPIPEPQGEPAQAQQQAEPPTNTPCALKPNRATRRKMASEARHAAHETRRGSRLGKNL